MNKPSHCGPTPETLSNYLLRDKARLKSSLNKLRNKGTIAVVIEIVQQATGYVLTSDEWDCLGSACEQAGLYLIVDEALTAVRCGAPFAHQLPQYRNYTPSFILFGKFLGTAGLGICWNGVGVHQFEFKDQTEPTYLWDHYPSCPLHHQVLLHSWGIVKLAKKRNWPQRAEEIGTLLRSLLTGSIHNLNLGGLAALIYIPTQVSRSADVVGAAVTSEVCRWLPYLDEGMLNKEYLHVLFGPAGTVMRRSLKNHIGFKVCIVCGETDSKAWNLCQGCCGNICSYCDGPDVQRHLDGKCMSHGVA